MTLMLLYALYKSSPLTFSSWAKRLGAFAALCVFGLIYSQTSLAMACRPEMGGGLNIEGARAEIEKIRSEKWGHYVAKTKMLLVPEHVRDAHPEYESAIINIRLFHDDLDDAQLLILIDVSRPGEHIPIDDDLVFIERLLPLRKVKAIMKDSVASPATVVPSFVYRPVWEHSDPESPHWIEIQTSRLSTDQILNFLIELAGYLDQRAERQRQLL
ncbi:MAG: hypothetical protein AAF202_12840 [Pseudomonadota bacterium]